MKQNNINKVKSYLCADLNAKAYNDQNFKDEIERIRNPYITFLFEYHHPFFKIIKNSENNNGRTDSFYVFTFLHKKDDHNIYLNIVVESTDIKKSTIIFSTRFRGNRFQYNAMLKSVIDYFTDWTPLKRSRLIKSKGITSQKPCFSLYLTRIFHTEEKWFSSVRSNLLLDFPNAFGILQELMINGQRLGNEYLDGTEINDETAI